MLHWLTHLFGWNHGYVVSEWSGDTLWIAFECSTCGKVSGAHPTGQRRTVADPATGLIMAARPPVAWRR